MKKRKDRNAGLTQLELPGLPKVVDPEQQALARAIAKAFEDEGNDGHEVSVTLEGAGRVPTFVPPAMRIEQTTTRYSVFSHWFTSYETKDPAAGYWCHLYDWRDGRWQFITKAFGHSISTAFQRGQAVARKLLVEGERPEAEARDPELARLVKYWRDTGEHLLARDQ